MKMFLIIFNAIKALHKDIEIRGIFYKDQPLFQVTECLNEKSIEKIRYEIKSSHHYISI